MPRGDRDQDVICALSTAQGAGAIAVVRVSGENCLELVRGSAPFLPAHPESHRVYFGTFKDKVGEPIDEVLVTYFAKGNSFTGEEVIEISGHGSSILTSAILRELVHAGCRTADRGEFTYRAFINGRMDLVQAEGIFSLIQSQSEQSAKQALRQLKGRLSGDLRKIESDLLWCLANIEVSIDFSQEDIEGISNEELIHRLGVISLSISKLVGSYRAGRILSDGVRLVLAGIPNVGKSSLLNYLVEQERAIVTEVPGTTRDIVEGHLAVDGYRVTVVDTAGLRETSDRVEKIGVERSYLNVAEADLVFFVFDPGKPLSSEEKLILSGLKAENTVLVANKADLYSNLSKTKLANELYQSIGWSKEETERNLLVISTKSLESTQDDTYRGLMLETIGEFIKSKMPSEQSVVVQARHFENLKFALDRVCAAKDALKQGVGVEFVALELKEAALFIQETLGEKFDDDILDRVFKEFCIGK